MDSYYNSEQLSSTSNSIARCLLQNEVLEKTNKMLSQSIILSNLYNGYVQFAIKHFSYTPNPDKIPPNSLGVETNVLIWLNQVEKCTLNDMYSDLDKIEIAKYFCIGDAKTFFEKCINIHGSNWIEVKAKFIAYSMSEPYDALQLVDKIINIERLPGECLQGIVLRLEDLGNRLELDKSYSNFVQPLLCDSFAKFLPLKFHRSLTEQDKLSLLTVLKKALIFQIENPDCLPFQKMTKNHVKTPNSFSNKPSQNSLSKKSFKKSPSKGPKHNKCQNSPYNSFHCRNSSNQLKGHNSVKRINYLRTGMKKFCYPVKSMSHQNCQHNYSPNSNQIPQNWSNTWNRRVNSRFQPKYNGSPKNCRPKQTYTNCRLHAPINSRIPIGTALDQMIYIITIIGCLVVLNFSTMIQNNQGSTYNY